MYAPIIKEIFFWRKKRLDTASQQFELYQEILLGKIISQNLSTRYLKNFGIRNVESFRQNCDAVHYDDIEPQILKIKNEHVNELCSEKIIAFSKSSGTTSRSKLLPMTKYSLKANFTAGKNMLSYYLSSNPSSNIIHGKNFSLTGSYHMENGYVIGDVSALFTYFLKPWYKPFRTPSKEIATIADWDEKLRIMTPILSNEDIRWIAGVPSWMSVVIDNIENYTQRPIHKVWKNLEVYFYGGVNIAPLENYFTEKFNPNLQLWQTYNASEGFFGLQSENQNRQMILLQDTSNYYEFIDLSEIDNSHPTILNSREIEIGKIYELVITNFSGLYRYRMGDLIEVSSSSPFKFNIIGRTKNYINVFGEELMVSNTEWAISRLSSELDLSIQDYTIAPIVMGNKGYHHWLIEFKNSPSDLTHFKLKLDEKLREINSDYDTKRYNNLILQNLEIDTLPSGSFNQWLEINKRKNVQAKIPKLWKDRSIQLEIIELSKQKEAYTSSL